MPPKALIFCFWAGSCLLAQPIADHHLHVLRSSASPPAGFALTADDLIRQMDEIGIRRAVVLSIAYQFSSPYRPPVENEYERVKTENDWTAAEAAKYPGRLVAFCGVNPLKPYAIPEIARCAADPRLRRGIKLHFGNSDVDLDNPVHVQQLRLVFAEANRHRMAIVAHIRSNLDHKRPWGARQARSFLENLLPAAPDVVVQIAHMAGSGGYSMDGADQAMSVFVDAIRARDPRMKRVYFDVSTFNWESKRDILASQLKAIGVKKLLYASDSPPSTAWKSFRSLPLSTRELRQIEKNVAPYLR